MSAIEALMLIALNFRYLFVGQSDYGLMEFASQQQQKGGPKSNQKLIQRELCIL